jgi:hypothetical protein
MSDTTFSLPIAFAVLATWALLKLLISLRRWHDGFYQRQTELRGYINKIKIAEGDYFVLYDDAIWMDVDGKKYIIYPRGKTLFIRRNP